MADLWLITLLLAKWGGPELLDLGFFVGLYIFAQRSDVITRPVATAPSAGGAHRMPALSPGFVVLIAAAFATSPSTAVLVGLTTPLIPGLWRGLLRSTFNAAQFSFYSGSAAAVFNVVQGGLEGDALGVVVAALVSGILAVFLNTGLVALVMSIERGARLRRLWHDLAWPTSHSIAFAMAALLVASVFQRFGAPAALLVLAPLFVLRRVRAAWVTLEVAHESTLRAFVRAVELKDPYTSRHSERVAEISVAIHRELGTRESDIPRRYYGALLHDIGKIAVPAGILTKPAALTREEFEHVKRHPTTGALVVNQVKHLRDLVPEVLFHHERIDGRGYPSGLVGEQIPFAARVVAVADTLEAITSDRPYRPGMPLQEAIEEIVASSGTQLDSTVVAALLKVYERGEVVMEDRPKMSAGALAGARP